jgi:sugar phosphate isomerase/epimerase
MRVGAHTYLFTQYGYDHAARLDDIFDTVAAAGFAAIELHRPMLDAPDWETRIPAAADRTGLAIVGASHSQPLWDLTRHDAILAEMEAHADQLARLAALVPHGGGQCGLTCSGKRYADRTPAENDHAIQLWTELGTLFRQRGLTPNYHTHGEPIADIRHVVDNVPADLVALGPDLDWLRVGGVDPLAFLREYGHRATMLHLRDYHLGGDRTEALGEGDADYTGLKRVLDVISFTGELVVELAVPARTTPTRPALELLTISRQHLRHTMGL